MTALGLTRTGTAIRYLFENSISRPATSYPKRRHVHTRKPLPYPLQNGLGNFLSPTALETISVEYQQGLLDRLSEEVKGTEQEFKSVVQTVIDTAPDRTKTLAFNYASQALNNSFFLDFLKPPPAEAFSNEADISDSLMIAIREDFGSMEQLKSTVSAAAMGLSASGWIWLACDDKGDLGVIPTFGPGTLLVRSRALQMPTDTFIVVGEDMDHSRSRQQKWSQPPISPASGLASSSESPMPENPTTPRTRSIHTSSRLSFLTRPSGLHSSVVDNKDLRSRENLINFGRLGVTLFPLFCISVHEHAWLTAGYGIWGKEDYLRRFWTVLDWKKVSNAFQKFAVNQGGPRNYTME